MRLATATAVLAAVACRGPEVSETGPARWASIGRSCPANAPATPLAQAQRDSLAPLDTNSRHEPEQLAALATVMPGGFAGLVGDSTGGLTLLLTDTSRRLDALAMSRSRGIRGIGLGDDTPVRRVRWNYAELYDWYRYLDLNVHQRGAIGFVSLGIDVAHNRITYGVINAEQRRTLERRLRELRVPCFLVAIAIERMPSVAAQLALSAVAIQE